MVLGPGLVWDVVGEENREDGWCCRGGHKIRDGGDVLVGGDRADPENLES